MKRKPMLMNSKLTGICGMAAPLVLVGSILLAIWVSPWFSFTENALSDLGAHERSGPIFNSGLMLAGVLLAGFGLGLIGLLREIAGRAAGTLMLADGVALFGIGLFPETAGRIHFYFSVAFFVLFPLFSLALAVHFLRRKSRVLALVALAVAVVAGAPWAFEWSGLAVPESISGGAASVWIMVLSVLSYRKKMP